MRRGIFHKYLLGFTSFFLVPMVVLSICLQIIMYRNLSREILGYNENILERLGDDLVTMNGRLMEAGNRISFSGPVVSRSRDAQNQIQMVDMLREENAANPYITKAYILYAVSYTHLQWFRCCAGRTASARLPSCSPLMMLRTASMSCATS